MYAQNEILDYVHMDIKHLIQQLVKLDDNSTTIGQLSEKGYWTKDEFGKQNKCSWFSIKLKQMMIL